MIRTLCLSVLTLTYSTTAFQMYPTGITATTSGSNIITRPMSTTEPSITTSTTEIDKETVWYADSNLSRSVLPKPIISHNNNNREEEQKEFDFTNAKFLIAQENGMVHLSKSHEYDDGSGGLFNGENDAVFLDSKQIKELVSEELLASLSNHGEVVVKGESGDSTFRLVWICSHLETQYWALSLANHYIPLNVDQDDLSSKDIDEIGSTALLKGISNVLKDKSSTTEETNSFIGKPTILPLREFGDKISCQRDAAIHATANGIFEFHKTHPFCSQCGSKTIVQKAGASRLCSNHTSLGGSCRSRSVYPRIDVASIMLITSPCENYALLGRKENWPIGRYSTLAGFLEVGETIEQCCARETLEESGVVLENSSIQFVTSQPWPFPRSLMAGFRAKASESHAMRYYDTEEGRILLPSIEIDEKEMQDIRWFHRSYVSKHLDGGSTAMSYKPTAKEREFHIPGRASLGRFLIEQWVLEERQ